MFLAHQSDLQKNLATPLIQFDKKKLLLRKNGVMIINNICPNQGTLVLTDEDNKLNCK